MGQTVENSVIALLGFVFVHFLYVGESSVNRDIGLLTRLVVVSLNIRRTEGLLTPNPRSYLRVLLVIRTVITEFTMEELCGCVGVSVCTVF